MNIAQKCFNINISLRISHYYSVFNLPDDEHYSYREELIFILLIPDSHNEESLVEMYRKDYIDVSNQEHTAPVYFQSLSLD